MAHLKIPPIQDVVRFDLTSVETSARDLEKFQEKKAGFFNYDSARTLACKVGGRPFSRAHFIQAAMNGASDAGKLPNADIIAIIYDEYATSGSITRPAGRKQIRVSRDIGIVDRPLFFYKTSNRFTIPIIQPRKTTVYSARELDIWATLHKETYCVDEFEGAHIEILDCAALNGGKLRTPRLIQHEDINFLALSEIENMLQNLASAFDLLCEQGYRARPNRSIAEDYQAELFR